MMQNNTKAEIYLAQMLGENQAELPVPQTKAETYLYRLAQSVSGNNNGSSNLESNIIENALTIGYSAKNILNLSEKTSGSSWNLTYIVNGDGSVSLKTTSSSMAAIDTILTITEYDDLILPKGSFKKSDGFVICSHARVGANKEVVAPEESCIFDTSDWNYENYTYKIGFHFEKGVVYNKTIFPMICDSRITDDTFSPYRKTIEERLKEIESRLNIT